MEATTTTNIDPTSILEFRGLGCCKYWLIGAWSEFKSPSVDFLGFITLGLEGLGFATWGALVLMIICGPTPSSNVISPMSLATTVGGLMNGSICMSKVFINVCYVFGSRMMIRANGVFKLIRGTISIEPIDYMGMS